MVKQSNVHAAWLTEHVINETSDIDIIDEYAPTPVCEVNAINTMAGAYVFSNFTRLLISNSR